MSQTIDNRIVEMQFENKQFESGVQESLSTLDKLKNALKFDDASKNLQDFSKNINKNVDLSGLSRSVEDVSSKFSASGIAGMEAIRKLTDFAIEAGKKIALALDAPFAQIRSGGWKRAMNIEDAKFQLKGLGIAWESVSKDIDYAVADTAYGLDVAAKACGQLSASGVQAGKDMKAALRGISGVATMGNTEYENISQIFTKAAGNGKVMADELNRISQYGLNARAEVVKFFNDVNKGAKKVQEMEIPDYIQENVKAITEGTQMVEGDLQDLVKKGKISFETFAYAMDYAFGQHAKEANETFMGTLRNIKAALSKIGAEFATPIIHGAIPIFNQIRIFLNDLRKQMGPVFTVFAKITEIVSGKLAGALEKFSYAFLKLGAIEHIGAAIKNVFTSIVKIITAVKDAFETVFPPVNTFNKSVMNVAKGIEHFSEKLAISNETAFAFRNVMVVVFNILKGIITVIKAILPSVGKILSIASKVVTVIAGLVAYLINLVSNLNIVKNTMNAIQKAGGLFAYAIEKIKEAFAKLKTILTDTTTVTGRSFLKLKEIVTTGAYLVGGALYLAFMKIKDVVSYFDTRDPLGSLVEGVKTLINNLKELTVVKKIIDGVEVVFGAVTLAVNKAVESVIKFVKAIKDGKSVFEALGSVALSVIGSISVGFTKLTDKIKSIVSDFINGFTQEKVIEESFETPMANATLGLTGFVQEISLTKKEVDGLDKSLNHGSSVLDNYQYQLKSNKTGLDKVKGSVVTFGKAIKDSVHEISLSKVLLTAWSGMLLIIAFNANLLIKKLTSLAGTLSGGFTNLFRVMPTRFDKVKAGIMMISTAIAVLAGSIYMLKDVPVDKLQEITKSLVILIGLVGGLSLVAAIISELMVKFSSKSNGFNFFSSNMFMLAAGVGAIVLSLKLLDSVNMKNIWTKVMVLGAIGAGLTAFSILMGKFAPQLSLGSIFMLAFAASVLILVKALDNLSHVELDGIVANYKELGVIIVSFAGFAALAGTVGVSSILSMIAFLFGIRTLLNSFDIIKDRLEEYHVGDLIVRFCKKLKDEIKAAVGYLKGIFDSLSDFDKGVIVAGIVAFTAGITAMLVGLSKAAKYLKKMAVSATILVASIAAVVYAITKIAQICNTIPQSSINKAISMLEMVGLLFVAILTVSAIFGGDVDLNWDIFGKNTKGKGLFKGKTKLGSKKFKKSGQTEYLKQARKMMADMAVLLASVALFMNTVGKLTDDEIDRAIPILIGTGVFALVLMSTVTAISSNARSAGKASASLAAFVGIIAVIGTLLGSFVILMNYFKNFDYTSVKDWTQLGLTILAIVGIVYSVNKLTKALKFGKQQTAHKTLGAFALLIAAIGGVVIYMVEHFTTDDLGRAGVIAIAMIAFLAILSMMVIKLEKESVKMFSTAKGNLATSKIKMFKTTMLAIIEMAAIIMLLGATLCSMATNMTGWDVGKMAIISFTLLATLAAIGAIVLTIQNLSKDKRFSLTKTSVGNLTKTLAMIAGFFVAFEILAGTLYAMSKNMTGWDVAKIVVISGTIVTVLTALATLGLAMQYFVKKMKTDWTTIGKAGVILGGMLAAFEILTLIFFQISKLNAEGVVSKAHAITLTLAELEALAVGLVGIGKLAKKWVEIGAGGVAIAAMIGMFELLVLIFGQIDKLKVEGIMAKSQTIALTLLEMEALVMGVIGIGALLVGSEGLLALGAAGGIAALWGMIALFDLLTDVFDKIDKLKTEGIMKKSQTIVLVMLELETLGLLSILTLPALVGGLGLKNMIDLFDSLAIAFTKIDSIHVDGLLVKSQIIALTMLELETILSVCSVLSVLALIGAPGLAAMVDIFGSLSEVFLIIDQMHVDGLQEKAGIIVDTLLKLEGLSAIGGFIGTILGPGLMLFATGIQAVGVACATVGNGLSIFSTGVEKLVKTGPGIQAWFTNVSVGVARLATTIMMTVTGLSKSVVLAINTLIRGIVGAITAGAALIFAATVALGKKMKAGFDSIVKPKTWGFDIVKELAGGILSNLGPIINAVAKVAHIIYSYLHFTNPDVGDAASAPTWMPDMMKLFGNGITSNEDLVLGPIKSIATGIKNTMSNIDLTGIINVGSSITGIDAFDGKINHMLQAIGLVKQGLASLNGFASSTGKLASTMDNAYLNLLNEVTKKQNAYEQAVKNTNRTLAEHKKAGTINKKVTAQCEEAVRKAKEEYDEANDALKRMKEGTWNVAQVSEEAADAVTGFGDAAGKEAKSVKEASDEIADFYDSIQGAISLFEEFNKETELTSDKLIENMRSQISGITEWSNQIQQLAFMGIDQGLLQQLAEMGPQGYEYTNAFVHMTAEQLAEANNLYHQSLMLPSKVTSQVYGSYTIAGRNAASGFLQGLQKEDIKSAAVNFAHQVVDQMNLALDIQAGKSMVTYEDGVAVVNGVKTGMNAAEVQRALSTATDLLTKNNITDKIQKGLIDNKYMYNIGTNITLGLAQGIESDEGTSAIRGAVIKICNEAISTATEATKEKSPSKVFDKIGRFITLGLAQGITAETEAAIHAMDETADSIISTMRDTINKANEALVNDVDDPVIKPVLDLSNIQEGSRELDNMLSRNSAFSASRSFSNLQNEQWNNQNALLNATMDNTDIVDAVTSLNEEVATLKDVMANIKVVLDTGTMVGAMTPAIDQSLGMRQVLAGRGI